jgi:hypothetical protein
VLFLKDKCKQPKTCRKVCHEVDSFALIQLEGHQCRHTSRLALGCTAAVYNIKFIMI